MKSSCCLLLLSERHCTSLRSVVVIANRNPFNGLVKTIYLFLFYLAISVNCYSQSIGILAGNFASPSDYFSLRYSHYSNLPVNGAIGIFGESSLKNGLNYSSYGLDVLGEYASTQGSDGQNVFGFKVGVGASWQIENEPWVYRDWPFKKRMNYGLVGEVAGEWFMTPAFSLSMFAQQKYLFNPALGRYRLVLGLGLAYRISSY